MPIIESLKRPDQVAVSETGIVFPQAIPFGVWRSFGQEVARFGSSLPWLIGDWLAFGREAFCERDSEGRFIKGPMGRAYDLAMEATGLEGQTLAIYAYVAANVPALIRIKPERLSWSHHREVASLAIPDQKRWLGLALKEGWSVSDLRQGIRRELASVPAEGAEAAPVSLTRLTTDFDRYLRKLEGDVEAWGSEQKRVIKQDLGLHFARAQEFYERI